MSSPRPCGEARGGEAADAAEKEDRSNASLSSLCALLCGSDPPSARLVDELCEGLSREDLSTVMPSSRWTPLQAAVLHGRVEAAVALVDRFGVRADGGAPRQSPPPEDEEEEPPAPQIAPLTGEQVEELFPGRNYVSRIGFGSSPLYLACLMPGRVPLEMVRLFLRRGVPGDRSEAAGGSPCHAAAFSGNADALRALAAFGADVSAPDPNGSRPVLSAAYAGHAAVVTYLCDEADCDPAAPRPDGWTSAFSAASNGQTAMLRLLAGRYGVAVGAGVWDGKGRTSPAFKAAQYGHTETVRALLDEFGCDAAEVSRHGEVLLHAAALAPPESSGPLAELLAGRSPEQCVRQRNSDGCTPAALAAFRGNAPCLAAVVAADRDAATVPTRDGRGPMHMAAFGGHTGCVEMLHRAAGVAADARSGSGSQPAHEAAFNGHTAVLRWLVEEAGADPLAPRTNGEPPLMLACFSGKLDTVRYLVEECDAAVDTQRSDGESALQLAAYNGHIHVCRYLLEERGANPSVRDSRGGTPLAVACVRGETELVEYLHDRHGCALDAAREDSTQAVHLAAYFKHEATLRALLRRGADPLARTVKGETPMHFAVHKSATGCVRALHEAAPGAAVVPNKHGQTPLMLAIKTGHAEAVCVLASERVVRHPAHAEAGGGKGPLDAALAAATVSAPVVDLLLAAGAPLPLEPCPNSPAEVAERHTLLPWRKGAHPLQAASREAERVLYDERLALVPVLDVVRLCTSYLCVAAPVPAADGDS